MNGDSASPQELQCVGTRLQPQVHTAAQDDDSASVIEQLRNIG